LNLGNFANPIAVIAALIAAGMWLGSIESRVSGLDKGAIRSQIEKETSAAIERVRNEARGEIGTNGVEFWVLDTEEAHQVHPRDEHAYSSHWELEKTISLQSESIVIVTGNAIGKKESTDVGGTYGMITSEIVVDGVSCATDLSGTKVSGGGHATLASSVTCMLELPAGNHVVKNHILFFGELSEFEKRLAITALGK
jgi:hypothetical protein